MSIRITSKRQEQLVLENQGLVHSIAYKTGATFSEYEDVVSVGKIGLIKAAATYDESKKVRFSSYATSCIKNEILNYYKQKNKHDNEISLDQPVANEGEDDKRTIEHKISGSKDFTEEIMVNDLFVRLISLILNYLKEKERIIMLYKIAGFNQETIAEILKFSRQNISKIEIRLIKQIKSYFEKGMPKFKETFSMAIVGDYYRISFESKAPKQFEKYIIQYLQRVNATQILNNFKITSKDNQVAIYVIAHPESFEFIALIIQEIENFLIRPEIPKR